MSFPFHYQDKIYYCGAACVMMVLDAFGADLADSRCGQHGLYAHSLQHSAEPDFWRCPPDGLAKIATLRLQQLAQAGGRLRYEFPDPERVRGSADASSVLHRALESIREAWRNTGSPVFVLGCGGEHWMLIHSIHSSGTDYWYGVASPSAHPAGVRLRRHTVGGRACCGAPPATLLSETGLRRAFLPNAAGKKWQRAYVSVIPTGVKGNFLERMPATGEGGRAFAGCQTLEEASEVVRADFPRAMRASPDLAELFTPAGARMGEASFPFHCAHYGGAGAVHWHEVGIAAAPGAPALAVARVGRASGAVERIIMNHPASRLPKP